MADLAPLFPESVRVTDRPDAGRKDKVKVVRPCGVGLALAEHVHGEGWQGVALAGVGALGMILDFQSAGALDLDDGPVNCHRWLFGFEIHIGPTNGHRLADPGAGGQHDINQVQDALHLQPVGTPGLLLPRVHALSKGDDLLQR